MKTTYTVPEVPGSKRKSDRPYTHAVIGIYDYDRAVKRVLAAEKECRKLDTDNFGYYKTEAEATVGSLFAGRYPRSAEDIEKAKISYANLNCTTAEQYCEKMHKMRLDDVENARVQFEGTVVVLRWSMSLQNASKGLSEFEWGYKSLKVVPCVPLVK